MKYNKYNEKKKNTFDFALKVNGGTMPICNGRYLRKSNIYAQRIVLQEYYLCTNLKLVVVEYLSIYSN